MINAVARTGQTLLMAASAMLFAAFSSALVVRRASSGDFMAPALPAWIWLTAPLVLAASWLAWRGQPRAAALCGTLLAFGQLALLAGLRMDEIGQAFFAVLMGTHGVHALGASAALWTFRHRATPFWHFAAGLWLYVLFLFGAWA